MIIKRGEGVYELLLKDAFAFTRSILHPEMPFVNTLHKKSFWRLDTMTTRMSKEGEMTSIIQEE